MKNKFKVKVLLVILVSLLLGSGVFLAKNTVFKPKPPKPPESIGFNNLEKEATESAKKKEAEDKKAEESEQGETQGATSQVVNTPTTPKPKPPTTVKPKPQLDSVSAAKLKQKIDQQLEAVKSVYAYYNEMDAPAQYFPLSYLNAAQASIDTSKSYDSLIKTNGTLAASAFNNCKLADQYYQEELYDLWNALNSAYYKDWDVFWNIIEDGQDKGFRAAKYTSACSIDLITLGY